VPIELLNKEIAGGIVETLGQMSVSPYPARPDYNSCRYCAFPAACDRGRAQREGDN